MRKSLRVLAALVVALAATLTVASPAHATEVSFVRTSSWGVGYSGEVTVTNNFDVPITGWEVAFYLPPGDEVIHAWNARQASDDPHYIYLNTSWNGALEPGESATFGFIVEGDGDPVFLWP